MTEPTNFYDIIQLLIAIALLVYLIFISVELDRELRKFYTTKKGYKIFVEREKTKRIKYLSKRNIDLAKYEYDYNRIKRMEDDG